LRLLHWRAEAPTPIEEENLEPEWRNAEPEEMGLEGPHLRYLQGVSAAVGEQG
jgi:hypothetical protein